MAWDLSKLITSGIKIKLDLVFTNDPAELCINEPHPIVELEKCHPLIQLSFDWNCENEVRYDCHSTSFNFGKGNYEMINKCIIVGE